MAGLHFVTATDTGAGKTFATAALVRRLRARGVDASALKPVAAGHAPDGINSDVAALLDAQGMTADRAGEINRYSFAAPLAPADAARAEGAEIDPETLRAWCVRRAERRKITLIEGVGGLMVPLAPGLLVADWLASMPAAEVILVVRARLGGINHALLTLEKLAAMGRPPAAVVVNDADGSGAAMCELHESAIRDHPAGAAEIHRLPHTADPQPALADLADRIAGTG